MPIISIANVPPQQRDQWLKSIKAVESKVSHLSAEVFDLIGGEVQDLPIGLDEAKEIREMLLKEREMMDNLVESQVMHEEFSFCGH
jgi:hypothetical protein